MNIAFLRNADDEHRLKVDALVACLAAGVDVPSEIYAYFGGTNDPTKGLEIDFDTSGYVWANDTHTGFEIPISTLPDDVRKLRFYTDI